EFHAPNRGKKEERFWNFRVPRRRRDAGCLRERLGKNHAGNKWITGKMTGEHRIIRGKRGFGFRESARVALDQFPHKDKRRSMRQTEERQRGWRIENGGWWCFAQKSILYPL